MIEDEKQAQVKKEIDKIIERHKKIAIEKLMNVGVSEDNADALFEYRTADGLKSTFAASLQGLGYTNRIEGMPELCSDPACIRGDYNIEGFVPGEEEYVQYWRNEEDGIILLRAAIGFVTEETEENMVKIDLDEPVTAVEQYFVGPEEHLKKINVDYKAVECPEKGECDNSPKVYSVNTSFCDLFISKFSKEDLNKYAEIIDEQSEITYEKIQDYCQCCGCPYQDFLPDPTSDHTTEE